MANSFQLFNWRLWQLRLSQGFWLTSMPQLERAFEFTNLWLLTWRLRTDDVFVWILYIIPFQCSKLKLLLFNSSMPTIEDSPLAVETPAIPAHSTNSQANTTHHMGAAALGVVGVTFTRRRYVTKWGHRNYHGGSLLIVTSRTIQDVVKPAIKTFLETCNTNPRIAVWITTLIPAL